ncbi:MAG TPA: NAD(P)H-hydrate dehydratase, partial [Actinomycetota bacterium]|nr:NAD(P)H-hydrate dehydratase [Actinomycetota bacterium]
GAAPGAPDAPDACVEVVERADVALQPWTRGPGSHKLTPGAVALLAGSDDIMGAALLTGRGALRAGGGYVILGSTRPVVDAAAVATPELVCHVLTDDSALGPDALDAFKPAVERASVLAIGSGLHRDAPQAALVRRVLDEIDMPVVLDADALNALDGDLGPVARRMQPTILTPHAGELARLLSIPRAEVEADRLGAATRIGRAAGNAVVVCKGEPTLVVGSRGASVLVVDSGGPELATAGTGDVLTGVVAARLTAVPDATAAAVGAAYVHGLAGRIAASSRASLGVVAWDVAEALPSAMQDLATGARA